MNTATTVGEVLANAVFKNFGRLLFPVDCTVTEDMTLSEIINYLIESAESDHQIFYPIYSETEMGENPFKRNTRLFCFRENPVQNSALSMQETVLPM